MRSYWGRVDPSFSMTVSLGEIWAQRHREKVRWRLELSCLKPRRTEDCQEQGEMDGLDPSLTALRRMPPADTLISDFRLWDISVKAAVCGPLFGSQPPLNLRSLILEHTCKGLILCNPRAGPYVPIPCWGLEQNNILMWRRWRWLRHPPAICWLLLLCLVLLSLTALIDPVK